MIYYFSEILWGTQIRKKIIKKKTKWMSFKEHLDTILILRKYFQQQIAEDFTYYNIQCLDENK